MTEQQRKEQGVEKEKVLSFVSEKDKVRQKIKALPSSEIILAMWQDAKRKGKDFREYLAEQLKEWNEEDYIRETYESFLRAVQMHDEKPWPNEKGAYWDENSTFEEWIYYCEEVLKMRLDKLREEKKLRPPSFEKLGKLREQVGDNKDTLLLVVENAGESQPLFVYEFYEEVMRKSLETLSKFKQGLVKIPPSFSWGDLDYVAKEEVEIEEVPYDELKEKYEKFIGEGEAKKT